MVLTVRAARPGDLAAATVLLNQIIVVGGSTAIESPLSQAEVAEWFLTPGPQVWCSHVALRGDVVVGFQSVGRTDKLPVHWGEMGTYAQIGQAQSGVGTALFAVTKQAAKSLGLTHLNAMIRCDNTGGLAYYSRMGFGDDRPAPEATLKSGQCVARVHKRFVLWRALLI